MERRWAVVAGEGCLNLPVTNFWCGEAARRANSLNLKSPLCDSITVEVVSGRGTPARMP